MFEALGFSMTTNIEMFDRCVASAISELYARFPVPIHMDFNELVFVLWDDEDDKETYFAKHELYANTVSWLERTGFIWLEKADNFEAFGVVLSPQELELVKMPGSLEKPGESLGAQLKEALNTGAKGAAATLVSNTKLGSDKNNVRLWANLNFLRKRG